MEAWGFEEEQPQRKPTRRMSNPLGIGLLLKAVQSLLSLGFKALELGRILPEDQQTTEKASQECEDVGHRKSDGSECDPITNPIDGHKCV